MILWRNGPSTLAPFCLILDRSKDIYGNDTDTFVEVLVVEDQLASVSSIGTTPSQVLFKQNNGAALGPLISKWTTIQQPSLGSLMNGNVVAFPIFPLVGYIGNPCMQAIAMLQPDCSSGSIVNTYLYGAIHSYLMCWVQPNICSSTTSTSAVGLRWD